MAGQLMQRGPDRWLIRVYKGRNATGKRIYINQTVRGPKREAERALRQLLTSKDSGALVRTTRQTLATYLADWLSRWCKPRVRAGTLDDYAGLIERHINPALGHHRLAHLTSDDIQGLYNAMTERGLSARTVRYTHAVLRSALKHALKSQLLTRNPADLTELPRHERREMRAMGSVDAGRFLTAAKSDEWYALWLLLLTGGLRPGEALGLKWGDLDGNRLHIQRALIPGSKGTWKLEDVKTERSRRVVVLPETTARALVNHRRKQVEQRLAAGQHYQDFGLVFAMPSGAPPDYRGLVQAHFKRVLKRAELPPSLRVYDLRHTAATLLLQLGENPKIVAERLGHSTVTQTLDTYSHVLPDMQERSATRLEQALFGA